MCNKMPHGFLVGVMLKYAQITHKKVRPTLYLCNYHGHASQSERHACVDLRLDIIDDTKGICECGK
jgi:hypothetical protein